MTRYGTEVRPWPSNGYWGDYSDLLMAVVGSLSDRLYWTVSQSEDGPYYWSVGAFSWTPYGDIWTGYLWGICATRTRAEREAETAATNFARRSDEARTPR